MLLPSGTTPAQSAEKAGIRGRYLAGKQKAVLQEMRSYIDWTGPAVTSFEIRLRWYGEDPLKLKEPLRSHVLGPIYPSETWTRSNVSFTAGATRRKMAGATRRKIVRRRR